MLIENGFSYFGGFVLVMLGFAAGFILCALLGGNRDD